ncbi:lipocalin family protein [Caulobacter sp. SSI4214]|uniref:lipocalin family protein n=1 Tax=Caulobacter sp. SSI4214 TaxID=2575739 RepID=UPI00143C35A5|nr:lipocalin family protein [Caulobacter sp. SSI4214]
MRLGLSFALSLSVSVVAGGAFAGAPPPARAVSPEFYSGRWYEIARTPNFGQRDCQAPTTDFVAEGARFKVRQVCHHGAPSGPEKVFTTKGRIIEGSRNTRFTMDFLGGLKKQEYWVLDCAPDHSWGVMATPGGHYVWLLSRQPVMPPAAKAAALARVKALGYDKLEFPEPAA